MGFCSEGRNDVRIADALGHHKQQIRLVTLLIERKLLHVYRKLTLILQASYYLLKILTS